MHVQEEEKSRVQEESVKKRQELVELDQERKTREAESTKAREQKEAERLVVCLSVLLF